MPPYLLFLETVVNTLVALAAAAISLFDPSLHQLARPRSIALRPIALAAAQPAQAKSAADPVIEALIAALKDPDAGVRREAASALGATQGDCGGRWPANPNPNPNPNPQPRPRPRPRTQGV